MTAPVLLTEAWMLSGTAIALACLYLVVHLRLELHAVRREVTVIRQLLVIWATLWGRPAEEVRLALNGLTASLKGH